MRMEKEVKEKLGVSEMNARKERVMVRTSLFGPAPKATPVAFDHLLRTGTSILL